MTRTAYFDSTQFRDPDTRGSVVRVWLPCPSCGDDSTFVSRPAGVQACNVCGLRFAVVRENGRNVLHHFESREYTQDGATQRSRSGSKPPNRGFSSPPKPSRGGRGGGRGRGRGGRAPRRGYRRH